MPLVDCTECNDKMSDKARSNNLVPDLLLEAAVIVNPSDELLVYSPIFQRDVSRAVLEMIAD